MACSNKWCLLGPHKPISNIYVSMHNSHAANSYESTNAGAKKSLWEWQLNVCFVFFVFLFSNFITLSETSATRRPDTVKLEVYLIGLPLSIISFHHRPPVLFLRETSHLTSELARGPPADEQKTSQSTRFLPQLTHTVLRANTSFAA